MSLHRFFTINDVGQLSRNLVAKVVADNRVLSRRYRDDGRRAKLLRQMGAAHKLATPDRPHILIGLTYGQ